eukprot:30294-Pelagococcus_subviridis.AAC.117
MLQRTSPSRLPYPPLLSFPLPLEARASSARAPPRCARGAGSASDTSSRGAVRGTMTTRGALTLLERLENLGVPEMESSSLESYE